MGIKRLLIWGISLLLGVGMHGQIKVDTCGVGIGSGVSQTTLKKYGIYLSHTGLFWERTSGPNTIEYFQIEISGGTPYLSGRFDQVVFYNSMTSKFQSVVAKNIYYNTSSANFVNHGGLAMSPNVGLADLDALYATDIAGDTLNMRTGVVERNFCMKSLPAFSILTGCVGSLQNALIRQNGELNDIAKGGQDKGAMMLRVSPTMVDGRLMLYYDIEEDAESAFIKITTMDDRTCCTLKIHEKGNGSIGVDQMLPAGIYRCSLIVDGSIAETSNIIVTDNKIIQS